MALAASAAATGRPASHCGHLTRICRSLSSQRSRRFPRAETVRPKPDTTTTTAHVAYVVSAFRACEQITLNAETAEAAEKKCPRISQRAPRALRSTSHFFTGSEGGHYVRLFQRGSRPLAFKVAAASGPARKVISALAAFIVSVVAPTAAAKRIS